MKERAEGAGVSDIVSKLRILSPLRMRRIDGFRKERVELYDVLQRDNKEHFLGAERFHRFMNFRATETKIALETTKGVIGETFLTRNLWAELVFAVANTSEPDLRTLIFEELFLELKRTNDPFKRKTIDGLLRKISAKDTSILSRVGNEEYYREQLLNLISMTTEDTLSKLFG